MAMSYGVLRGRFTLHCADLLASVTHRPVLISEALQNDLGMFHVISKAIDMSSWSVCVGLHENNITQNSVQNRSCNIKLTNV